MNHFKKASLSLLFFALLGFVAQSQIVINEYSAANLAKYPDNFSKYEDWIELYNTSDQSVSLEGWFLSDKEAKPLKWQFPAGVSIGPNQFKFVWCSGRDSVNNFGIHTNFKLSQTSNNEVLMLSSPDETLVNSIPLNIAHLEHSWARTTDGADDWMACSKPTLGAKNNNSNQFTGYLIAPVISLEAGFYQGDQIATIITEQTDVEIRYTIDGSLPTLDSDIYVEGTEIEITESMILKAGCFSADPLMMPSIIDFKSYFINEDFTLPVFSVGADDIIDLANGEGTLRPVGSLEYFDADKNLVASSYGELNRHGQDSWILPHRSLDWISRDEMAYNKTVKAKLFTYSERDDYQRFMFRASGDDNYPANNDFNHIGSCHVRDEYVHALAHNGDMKLDVRAVERVVVFLNGQYWGVYGLRERPADHDYTEEYYDQDKYHIQYLTTWGNTQAEYGGNQTFTDWIEFRDFILDNDMADDDNYQFVKDRLQLKGLCDYMIANLNTVASDWLNYNTGWWRGLDPEGDHKKWGYILWDNDATFDYYINYSGVPNTDPDATACDIDEIADFMDEFFQGGDVGQHEKIFLKLLDQNNDFQQLYFSRQADLLNTVFNCENMLTTFDSMITTIAPEMPRQIERWGGSMQEWTENVQTMRTFIEARCTLIDDGMVECYDLTGPYAITLKVEPEGAGEIEFNTLDIASFPWTGEYFGNMENIMTAKSLDPDLDFLYWKTANGSVISPDSTLVEAAITVEGEEELTAVFGIKVGVNEEITGLDLQIYPTIISSEINLDIDLNENKDLSFRLLNVNSQEAFDLSSYAAEFSSGKNSLTINLTDQVSSGVYFLQVNSENKFNTLRVIVAK